jgi:RNA 2',3'-cyclic 3'-phosphodiesterase
LEDLPDKIRAFVALRMSAEVETAIARMVAPMREVRSGIRWVRLSNLHVTLRFLGDRVERGLLEPFDKGLDALARTTLPFIVEARGTRAFPNLDRPRVIWIGLASEQLIQLAQAIENTAVAVGFVPEARHFSPHLTIGRLRDLHGWQRIREVLRETSNQDFGASPVSEMGLYRSILGGEASQYQELARYRLAGEG